MISVPALSLSAPAKINLFLQVTGRRADGYHTLHSLVTFAPWAADTITLTPAQETTLTIEGPFAQALKPDDDSNLILRALRAVEESMGRAYPTHIHLTKNLPLGGGIGGGSSDAAMTIRGLEQLYSIVLTAPQKSAMLLKIGADVPVCYEQKSVYFRGIGDEISQPVSLTDIPMMLIWPNVHADTRAVFSERTKRGTAFSQEIMCEGADIVSSLRLAGNDLTDAACALYPAITDALIWMSGQDGCTLAQMSGSGATIFGLFENQAALEAAWNNAKNTAPADWWMASSLHGIRP